MTNTGERLDELADSQPQLVVFLRHAGCTFCRESLAELSKQRSQIESTGCGIVLVHLGQDDGEEFFAKYDMQDVPSHSGSELSAVPPIRSESWGTSPNYSGVRVWIRGVIAGLIYGHGRGPIMGNSFQMPGIYLYHSGQVLRGYQHEQRFGSTELPRVGSDKHLSWLHRIWVPVSKRDICVSATHVDAI